MLIVYENLKNTKCTDCGLEISEGLRDRLTHSFACVDRDACETRQNNQCNECKISGVKLYRNHSSILLAICCGKCAGSKNDPKYRRRGKDGEWIPFIKNALGKRIFDPDMRHLQEWDLLPENE